MPGAIFRQLSPLRVRPRLRGKFAATSLLLLVVFSIALYSTGSTPEPREITEDARNDKVEEETSPRAAVEPVRTTYYGEEFAGVPTASGEFYDPNGFTAAHPYLPFGTRILVSHEGHSALVTINDRIPEESDHDLDLSLAAAREIGLAEVGTAVVDVEVLGT